MSDQSVWASPDHRLINVRTHVSSEVFTERPPAIATQQAAEQNESNAYRKEGPYRNGGKCPDMEQGEQECSHQRKPLPYQQQSK